MRKLLSLVIVLALLVIGVGFYRGWFTLSRPDADPGSNKVDVNLTVDRDKIQEDAETVKKKTSDLVGKPAVPTPEPGDKATADR